MATGGGQPSAQRVTCAVCLERYRRPKLLPCFHTFCLTCLESLAPPPAPSLTCPQCRAVVPLPLGGAVQFQSNFYIEEQLMSEGARKCDVCSESRDVEYRCVECQQYYCAPCRTIHDKITTTRRHTLLPFSLASAAQHDQREGTRRCPKHDFQRQIFFCKVCDVTICPHCKLTSHEGHATEDVGDTAIKARQDLQTIMTETQQRMRKLEILEADTKKRKEKLLTEFNSADDVIKKRAVDAIEWAEQAREEALGRARELCHVTEDCLNQTLEATQHTMSSLTARTDHVTAVLSGQDHTEVIQLLANITAADLACRAHGTADQKKQMQETDPQSGDRETDKGGDLLVHQKNEDNLHSAIIGYIGHVSSTQSALPASLIRSAWEDTPVNTESSTLQGSKDTEGCAEPIRDKITGNDQTITADTQRAARRAETSLPPASRNSLCSDPQDRSRDSTLGHFDSCFQHQPLPEQLDNPTEVFTSGSGSQAVVSAMCLTADNKLWVKYKPPNTHTDILKLFDAKGNLVNHWKGSVPKGNFLTCIGDTLLSPLDWRWLAPSGESGCLDNDANDWALCSKSLPPHLVLCDPSAGDYKIYKLHVRSLHPLKVELVAVSQQGVKLNTPVDFDAASCGLVFCFLTRDTIDVHCVDTLSSPTKLVRLSLTNTILSRFRETSTVCHDICFFKSDEKDMLCVITDRRILKKRVYETCGHVFMVVDHEDGFNVKLKEENEVYECTKVTAHHTQGRLWLGDKGGQIRVRDMTKYIPK
ncbi:uncharacterized protein [Littorina saxatilis]|uniref:uncharacterized protein n=1 Tax=Littorina saxatilis TaxID=31220 RepID=UPI0038B5E0FD